MLVLTRKKNESVIIGDNIAVRVCEIRGDRVRLGFTAPRGVQIHRSEVWVEVNPNKQLPEETE